MIQGFKDPSDGDGVAMGSNNKTLPNNRGEETNDTTGLSGLSVTTASDPQPIAVLAEEVNMISEKFRELENILISRDTTMTTSVEDLFTTLKTLSHNQTILENKLDDALKNQMNTDLLVNSINSRMNHLSTTVLNLSKTMSSGTAPHTNGNLNGSLAAVMPNGSDQSRPTSVRRGPGRPRKDGSSGRVSDSRNSNNKGQVNPVKISLPTGAVQVSKSKRYFIDPSTSTESLKSIKTDPYQSPSSKENLAPSSAPNPGIPVKRKRGRPPKKRTVETVIINQKNVSNAEDEPKPKVEEEEEAEDDDVDEHDKEENNNINNNDLEANVLKEKSAQENEAKVVPSSLAAPRVNATSSCSSASLSTSPPSSSRSSSPSSPPSNVVPSAVETAETSNFPDNEEVNPITAENPIITTRIITPLARKRLLGANVDSDNIIVEMSSSSVATDPATDSTADTNRQQRELDKRRDSREKMLVNMKYNDREKAKSFMESNKKLLKAMREEERRKRMTALINGSQMPPNSHAQQQSTSVPSTAVREYTFKTEEPSQRSKKIGISSMLNSDVTSPGDTVQETIELLNRKRTHENDRNDEFDDNQDGDDDQNESRHLRKRRPSILGNSPSSMTLENSPSSENGTSLVAQKKTDSQASLLLASPIELLCRDGFFYQRNLPHVPITTGAYLDFKFKSKEDELISLTMSQKDFADRTRHDRMNAHFLKPEIDLETEQAFNILSNTTLTEKYVNSLEYFLMEFRWENKLVGLGLKLRESKRTWQRRKALFTLFEFWRDQSREKRKFQNYTILHAVKEMENYRIFINRSVSWFYNHITLLKMILYDLCDNVDTQWREWMFPKEGSLPILNVDGVNESNINEAIDNVLTLDFLDDGTENNQIKSSKVIPPNR